MKIGEDERETSVVLASLSSQPPIYPTSRFFAFQPIALNNDRLSVDPCYYNRNKNAAELRQD